MPDKQRTLGQYETPDEVADLLLTFCLRRPGDQVLDPGCGAGSILTRVAAWQAWHSAPDPALLWGLELDEEAAQAAQGALPGAQIRHANFFACRPETLESGLFDAIVGNPPYTRAGWIGQMQSQLNQQPTLFGNQEQALAPERQALIPERLWGQTISRRAGLHAYFFLHSLHFLREGGRLGFVVPNSWLDVAYGEALKAFILDHFRVVALIESSVERWFKGARVNTCLIILEKCSDAAGRRHNLARFIQLRQPLAGLLPDGPQRFGILEGMVVRLLPAADKLTDSMQVRVLPQRELRAEERWGVALRAPAVYQRATAQGKVGPLSHWLRVQRGFTTGDNSFFYPDSDVVEQWQIEPGFRRPLLKSLRGLRYLRLGHEHASGQALVIPPTSELQGTQVAAYVVWGEAQGVSRRNTVAGRFPWYSLPYQEPPPLVLPKGIWRWHFAPVLSDGLLIDQQLYGLYPAAGISPQLAAALLNSSWTALQLEVHGRLNFGNGVLWLAAYELENLRLPDPRMLTPGQQDELTTLFNELAQQPESDVLAGDLDVAVSAVRQALDELVFSLLGLSRRDAQESQAALQQRVAARLRRARSGQKRS